MKPFQLRLYEDVIAPNHAPVYLPAARRAIFVVRGDVAIEFETGAQHHPAHSAWLGEDDVALNAGSEGATLWRWELMSGDAPTPGEIASAPVPRCSVSLPVDAGAVIRESVDRGNPGRLFPETEICRNARLCARSRGAFFCP